MDQEQMEIERPAAFVQACIDNGLTYKAEFVPWSKSRNAGEKQPSLNWRVTLTKGGVSLSTDYMQGIGHLPGYKYQYPKTVAQDDYERRAAETGQTITNNGWLGRAIPAPELTDVLFSLVMDSDALDYVSFEDWAESFGYDTDSREAERIYSTCIEIALQLRHLIDLDEAREAFQDY